MLHDAHIHVGNFNGVYTTPNRLIQYLDDTGIDKFAVSSTTICIEDYHKVISELTELILLAKNRVYPVLWLTPLMLKNKQVSLFLECGIKWSCVKIHPYIHRYWTDNPDNMEDAVELAKSLQVPLLIHTGYDEFCQPFKLEKLISNHPEQIVIIAHSRPGDQTLSLISRYPNAYCDTAFAPIEDIVQMTQMGFAHKILWGTDIPVHLNFYQNIDIPQYCKDIANNLQESICDEDYLQITQTNFLKIFNSQN